MGSFAKLMGELVRVRKNYGDYFTLRMTNVYLRYRRNWRSRHSEKPMILAVRGRPLFILDVSIPELEQEVTLCISEGWVVRKDGWIFTLERVDNESAEWLKKLENEYVPLDLLCSSLQLRAKNGSTEYSTSLISLAGLGDIVVFDDLQGSLRGIKSRDAVLNVPFISAYCLKHLMYEVNGKYSNLHMTPLRCISYGLYRLLYGIKLDYEIAGVHELNREIAHFEFPEQFNRPEISEMFGEIEFAALNSAPCVSHLHAPNSYSVISGNVLFSHEQWFRKMSCWGLIVNDLPVKVLVEAFSRPSLIQMKADKYVIPVVGFKIRPW
ncbi:hypothetical protein [Fervidobacterium islandicum]|uniref:hypothetical protein n=1 Tax=Fervidobacterium islandicum TaxID=2423 RepID=UPI003A697EBB